MSQSLSPGRVKNSFFFALSKLALGPTQASIQWVPGPFIPRVKQPGHEADKSPPSSAEVKRTSTPKCVFVVQCLIS
jgi:hypothetical protein